MKNYVFAQISVGFMEVRVGYFNLVLNYGNTPTHELISKGHIRRSNI